MLPRIAVAERAAITVPGSGNAIPCSIENISLGGAKLDFGVTMILPARFDLEIGPHYRVRCELVWLKATKAGVRFIA